MARQEQRGNLSFERIVFGVSIYRARLSEEESRRHLNRWTRPAEHTPDVNLRNFDQKCVLFRSHHERPRASLERARPPKMIGVSVRDENRLKIERGVNNCCVDQVIFVQTDVGLPENARDVVQFDDFLLHAVPPPTHSPAARAPEFLRTKSGTGCTSYCRRSSICGYSAITLTDYDASNR